MSASRSTISTSRATWTAVSGLSPVIMMHYVSMSVTAEDPHSIQTHPVRRIGQHLECFDGIRLEWTMEYQKPCENQVTFDRLPRQLINLQNPFAHQNQQEVK